MALGSLVSRHRTQTLVIFVELALSIVFPVALKNFYPAELTGFALTGSELALNR